MSNTGLVLKGNSVSPGMAQGIAYVLEPAADGTPVALRTIAASEVEAELERLDLAISRAEKELLALQGSVAENLGEAESEIFGAHAMLVRSPSLRIRIAKLVREKRLNVEAALAEAVAEIVRAFDAMRDESMRQRSVDLRDIGRRILSALLGEKGGPCASFPEEAILIADELRPSITATLQRCRVRGLVTERGGRFGHAAILARSSSTPAVFAVRDATLKIKTGDQVAVDAMSGTVFVNAGSDLQGEFDRMESEARAFREGLRELIDEASVTLDGTRITLMANVSEVGDTELALLHKAEGIGLYRTEASFAAASRFPTEEEQYQSLARGVGAIYPHKAVLRLLDIGGDKQLDYLPLPATANPALAPRGIRLLLSHPEILHRQLRAFLRVSAVYPVSILLPVVTDMDDVSRTREALLRAEAELASEGVPFAADIRLGIMLEVPAAALLVSRFAEEVDFFSLGTNDLVQYLLAADRDDSSASYYLPLHPAFLALVQSVVSATSAAGRPLSICGEVAGDPLFTELLVGLGLREFSLAPRSLLDVKRVVRSIRTTEAEQLAAQALRLGSAAEVEALLVARGGHGEGT